MDSTFEWDEDKARKISGTTKSPLKRQKQFSMILFRLLFQIRNILLASIAMLILAVLHKDEF